MTQLLVHQSATRRSSKLLLLDLTDASRILRFSGILFEPGAAAAPAQQSQVSGVNSRTLRCLC
ncbi:unnamed protein product [Mycena citricolor]|uniref:Uncharacterized protein n=1 Tax=Mycena citricolor TaxID=2018698 RepID=A0AAD2Q395_9AGAR|nr:unnamed protein product [Mycena citricolor]